MRESPGERIAGDGTGHLVGPPLDVLSWVARFPALAGSGPSLLPWRLEVPLSEPWVWVPGMPVWEDEIPDHPMWAYATARNEQHWWATRVGRHPVGVMAIDAQDVLGHTVEPHAKLVPIRRVSADGRMRWDWGAALRDIPCRDFGEALARAAELRRDVRAIVAEQAA